MWSSSLHATSECHTVILICEKFLLFFKDCFEIAVCLSESNLKVCCVCKHQLWRVTILIICSRSSTFVHIITLFIFITLDISESCIFCNILTHMALLYMPNYFWIMKYLVDKIIRYIVPVWIYGIEKNW